MRGFDGTVTAGSADSWVGHRPAAVSKKEEEKMPVQIVRRVLTLTQHNLPAVGNSSCPFLAFDMFIVTEVALLHNSPRSLI